MTILIAGFGLKTIDFALFPLVYYDMHEKKTRLRNGRDNPPGFRGRIWIDGEEGTFLGYGRITLLERIREHGSITKAAKSMGMSYRHAWELVNSMNRQAVSPIVEAVSGGKGGGGARLTGEGEKAINLFRDFYNEFQKFLKLEERKSIKSAKNRIWRRKL